MVAKVKVRGLLSRQVVAKKYSDTIGPKKIRELAKAFKLDGYDELSDAKLRVAMQKHLDALDKDEFNAEDMKLLAEGFTACDKEALKSVYLDNGHVVGIGHVNFYEKFVVVLDAGSPVIVRTPVKALLGTQDDDGIYEIGEHVYTAFYTKMVCDIIGYNVRTVQFKGGLLAFIGERFFGIQASRGKDDETYETD